MCVEDHILFFHVILSYTITMDFRSELAKIFQPRKRWLFVILTETGSNDAFSEHLSDFRIGHVSFIGAVDEQEDRALGRFPIPI